MSTICSLLVIFHKCTLLISLYILGILGNNIWQSLMIKFPLTRQKDYFRLCKSNFSIVPFLFLLFLGGTTQHIFLQYIFGQLSIQDQISKVLYPLFFSWNLILFHRKNWVSWQFHALKMCCLATFKCSLLFSIFTLLATTVSPHALNLSACLLCLWTLFSSLHECFVP